jgi:hypothetical protein
VGGKAFAAGPSAPAATSGTESSVRYVNRENKFMCAIQGQLLRRSDRREVAIYLREGALWVADFIDGHGELVDAITWFRFHCGGLSSAQTRRRMVRESAVPLSTELVARIEQLHRDASLHKGSAAGEGDVSVRAPIQSNKDNPN